jgi:hypothetical protein
MADIAITELPVATTAATTDVFPVVQSDVTRQITLALMFTGATLTNPALINPTLGTPASGDLSNCTGSPVLTSPALGNATATTLNITGNTTSTGSITSIVNITSTGNITAAGNVLISGTGKLGYTTGSGGTVTQATSKSTGVALNKTNGQITLNSAALAADTTVSFTITNTTIAASDVLVLNHISGGTPGSYLLNAQASAGSAIINVRNITAASLSEAIVLAFVVIKAVTA